MRIAIGIIVLATLLWCGWWFFAANQQEQALVGWLLSGVMSRLPAFRTD